MKVSFINSISVDVIHDLHALLDYTQNSDSEKRYVLRITIHCQL